MKFWWQFYPLTLYLRWKRTSLREIQKQQEPVCVFLLLLTKSHSKAVNQYSRVPTPQILWSCLSALILSLMR